MTDDIAIKVEHVSKDFVLPHEKVTSVKSAFTSLYKRKNKSRETQHALKDISFEVKKGEFFGIVGRNGSGKSTMLKILANIYQPTKGSVTTRGKLVPFIELGVGFNPELTGRENVYLNGAMLGFSRREIDAMYEDIVSFAELERFMDQKLKNYSSGMQVRLAFSMATRSEAEILLVDEVLAVGDADFQRKCFEYFKQLKKNKKTVIFVSHDMDAIREYCDRAVLIEKSELIVEGRSDKVASRYSRMFIDQSSAQKGAQKANRWGDEKVKITSVTAIPAKLTGKNIPLEIKISIEAYQDVEGPLVGFDIKNATGHILTGTNTKLQRITVGALKKGDRREVIFELPNIFTDGNYVLDVAVVADNGAEHDWWEEVKVIECFEETPLPFLVSPPIKTRVLGA